MVKTEKKYFAFISYSSKDTRWGKKLQRKLEHYRMPASLCTERGWARTPIRPVFFAPSDIQPGVLTNEIQERLCLSRNLIVICSPNSAKSKWVAREIAFFHSIGRTDNIHYFIVDGIPHSGDDGTECFNPILEELGLPESLGANVNEKIYKWKWLNRERAYVQIISRLLQVEFDTIWKRHRRLMAQKVFCWLSGLLVFVACIMSVWFQSRPVDVSVSLNEISYQNDNLPPLKDARLILYLDNEQKIDTIPSLVSSGLFANIPSSYINKEVRLSFQAPAFLKVDTTIYLKKNMVINIYRDSLYYGNVDFRFWDSRGEVYVKDVSAEIEGRQVASDISGRVQLYIPLKLQKPYYIINSRLPLMSDTLYMPSGRNSVIEIK